VRCLNIGRRAIQFKVQSTHTRSYGCTRSFPDFAQPVPDLYETEKRIDRHERDQAVHDQALACS
jgi:hypothetical protein